MGTSDTPGSEQGATRGRFRLGPDAIATLLILLVTIVCCWENFVGLHEELYFLGSRRLADPSFLSVDFTWARLSVTTALFDHLIAPLWKFLDAFTIANIGRLVTWALTAWSIVRLARTVKLPPWAAVAGFTLWILWEETLGLCGAPYEGFQPKSFAYPLIFLSLSDVLRGRVARAGMALGLATVFHIVVGGWALLGLFLTMAFNRRLFTWRQVGVLLLASAPFVVPLVLALTLEGLHVTHAEQLRMDDVYVMFSMPHCCDVFYFLSSRMVPLGWVRALVVFLLAPIVLFAWPERRGAMVLGSFVTALVVFFAGGVVGRALMLNSVLKTYPFQLANALPALFLFMFVAGWLGVGGTGGRIGRVVRPLVLVTTLWLLFDRGVPRALWEKPQYFMNDVRSLAVLRTDVEYPVFGWIRDHTPKNSVFITPFVAEFWPYAERAQVASMRQPPLDLRLIEWKERLEAMNGFQPFQRRGWETAAELEQHERELSVADLMKIRDRYGATHYMIRGDRPDLRSARIYIGDGYSIFDLSRLAADGGHG